jgi:hypothetical protein
VGLRQAGIPHSQKSETFLKVFPHGEDDSEGLGHKTQAQHNNERKYLFFSSSFILFCLCPVSMQNVL